MVGKIIATQYMSLDGVIEDPVGMESSGLGDWTGPFDRGAEGDQFKHEELMNCRALILGHKTYEAFAAVWPSVEDKTGYAERMNQLPKHLASRTIKEPEWSNARIVRGDLIEATRSLKASQEGDILIFGSASVIHALLPRGLIDEYRLMVYPTVLGWGARLFPQGAAARVSLLESRRFGDGIVLLRYGSAEL